MSVVSTQALAWTIGSVLLASSGAENVPIKPAEFAPPTRLEAGDTWLGAERLYPSPVLHDVDGDGRLDVVVGDLFGRVTVAPGLASDKPNRAFGAEAPLFDRRGQKLRFHNW
jgi:hypothetical protein